MQGVNRRDGGGQATGGWMSRGTNVPIGGRVRQCSRPGCCERAEATLTYDYRRSQVWLDDLSVEREPHAYDMCLRHAERLSAPHGWRVEDRRARGHDLIAV